MRSSVRDRACEQVRHVRPAGRHTPGASRVAWSAADDPDARLRGLSRGIRASPGRPSGPTAARRRTRAGGSLVATRRGASPGGWWRRRSRRPRAGSCRGAARRPRRGRGGSGRAQRQRDGAWTAGDVCSDLGAALSSVHAADDSAAEATTASRSLMLVGLRWSWVRLSLSSGRRRRRRTSRRRPGRPPPGWSATKSASASSVTGSLSVSILVVATSTAVPTRTNSMISWPGPGSPFML